MLGDAEHPISFLFEPRVEGRHVKVTVRAGQRGHRGYAGELTFRREEWAVLADLLALDGRAGFTLLIDDDGVAERLVIVDDPPIDVAPPIAREAPTPGGPVVVHVQTHDDGGFAAGYAQGLADGRVSSR